MGRGGGRGFRGGGGFGSSSRPSFHHNSTSDSVIRDAAASKGLRSFGSGWWSKSLMEHEKLQRCKGLVASFEECAILRRKGKGKDSPLCQSFLKELEIDCADYKSSWSDWWSKKKYCQYQLSCFERCMTYPNCSYSLRKELRDMYRVELNEVCDMMVVDD